MILIKIKHLAKFINHFQLVAYIENNFLNFKS